MSPEDDYFDRSDEERPSRRANRIAYEMDHFGIARLSYSQESQTYLLSDGTTIPWDNWFARNTPTWAMQDWERDDWPEAPPNNVGVVRSLAALCRGVVPC